MRTLLMGVGLGVGGAAVAAVGAVELNAYVRSLITEAIKDAEQANIGVQPSPAAVIATPTPSAPEPATIEVASQTFTPAAAQPFESMSYCDQLDAIAKAGKSVSEYILGSPNPEGYIWAGRTACNWHSEQANIAHRVLNPPPPIVIEQPIVVQDQGIHDPDADLSLCDRNVGTAWWYDHCTASSENVRSKDEPEEVSWQWNNCNGVREPGESFSAECFEEQTGRPPELGYGSN